MPKLTLLTDPIPVGQYYWYSKAKSVIRMLRKRLDNKTRAGSLNDYGGHSAVTRSAVEGLKKLGVSFNYNPSRTEDVAETVIVLSGLKALRQAIELKDAGIINRIIAGTNIALWPSMCPDLYHQNVDMCITPSDWVAEAYIKECNELNDGCVSWPAGVDVEYWSPCPQSGGVKKALIFEKSVAGPIPSIDRFKELLSTKGYDVKVIRRDSKSSYTRHEYKRALQDCSFMFGFSRSESQGLAWAEAWSMNVPTFIWYNNENCIAGKSCQTSSAPYLTEACGSFFEGYNDFSKILSDWEQGGLDCHPREWVLKNMSDEVCARKLCELAGITIS